MRLHQRIINGPSWLSYKLVVDVATTVGYETTFNDRVSASITTKSQSMLFSQQSYSRESRKVFLSLCFLFFVILVSWPKSWHESVLNQSKFVRITVWGHGCTRRMSLRKLREGRSISRVSKGSLNRKVLKDSRDPSFLETQYLSSQGGSCHETTSVSRRTFSAMRTETSSNAKSQRKRGKKVASIEGTLRTLI